MTGASATDVFLAPSARPLVGVIHLPPLAGPDALTVDALVARVATDARALRDAGFDGVLVENYGDAPYPKGASEPHVAAVMARAVHAAAAVVEIPVGANVLRNDTLAALAACHAGGGTFVRANVYTGASVTDQGIIEGNAFDVVRYRRALGLERGPGRVVILADVDVKHAAQVAARPIEALASEMVHRAAADVILVTGRGTGQIVDLADVERARRGAPGVPVWVASGVDEKNMGEMLNTADGVIVGTSVKEGGSVRAPVDPVRARKVAKAAGKAERSG